MLVLCFALATTKRPPKGEPPSSRAPLADTPASTCPSARRVRRAHHGPIQVRRELRLVWACWRNASIECAVQAVVPSVGNQAGRILLVTSGRMCASDRASSDGRNPLSRFRGNPASTCVRLHRGRSPSRWIFPSEEVPILHGRYTAPRRLIPRHSVESPIDGRGSTHAASDVAHPADESGSIAEAEHVLRRRRDSPVTSPGFGIAARSAATVSAFLPEGVRCAPATFPSGRFGVAPNVAPFVGLGPNCGLRLSRPAV